MIWLCIAVLAVLVLMLFAGLVAQQRRIDVLEKTLRRRAAAAVPDAMDRRVA